MQEFLTDLNKAGSMVVLTGAGLSIESGIPSYRDAAGQWQAATPIQHNDFIQDPATRARYWARSMAGWPVFSQAQPNAAHRALNLLHQAGVVTQIITQNVDRLHQKSGSAETIDLHGRLDCVVCLHCAAYTTRQALQERLVQLNPQQQKQATRLYADGDAGIETTDLSTFAIPECLHCGGVLKPDVVFFGDTLARATVLQCKKAVENAQALLVIASSLQVYSGYRFCRWAVDARLPIFSINPGKTRADALITHHCRAPAQSVLMHWCQRLGLHR